MINKFIKIPNTKCHECGIPYYIKPSCLLRTKYCSSVCRIKNFAIGRKPGFKLNDTQILRLKIMAASRVGDKSPNWKGGNSRGYKTGYYSKEYKQWRSDVFLRDNYTCQICGITGNKTYLTAHHIKSFAHYPELRFSLDNGMTLCEPCHSRTDNYKGRNMNKK